MEQVQSVNSASAESMNTTCGSIYILTNPALPDLVKIGYADDPFDRLQQLNSHSGTPAPFYVYATYDVYERVSDKKIHAMIDMLNPELRYAKNREFFTLTPQQAYDILYTFAFINGLQDNLHFKPYDGQNRNSAVSPLKSQKPIEQQTIYDEQSLINWCQRFVVENYTFHASDVQELYDEYKTWCMNENYYIAPKTDFDKYIKKAYNMRQAVFVQPYTGVPTTLYVSRGAYGKVEFKHTFPQSFIDWCNKYLKDNVSFHLAEQEAIYNDYQQHTSPPIMPFDTFTQALCEKYNKNVVSKYIKDQGYKKIFLSNDHKPLEPISEWAEKYLEENGTFAMKIAADVYENYKEWAMNNNYKIMSRTHMVKFINKTYGTKVENKYHSGVGTVRTFIETSS